MAYHDVIFGIGALISNVVGQKENKHTYQQLREIIFLQIRVMQWIINKKKSKS